ncbi:hypothetical protein Cob_v009431 [Colletotrichum orbiculare MAFF 240422]|uniref:Cyclin-like f-box n=1 Tax=Colletotrichum orbiculare (strain 104-T / ATCC 96160 / CBS 514.97 / LARS 414 / MAFF 240422) TaxID=1213857 RepID=N4V4X9_COLOR|nr:hypothetical protein Cob_v009431 [Colletotrichum orbiculare MAFF 240422]
MPTHAPDTSTTPAEIVFADNVEPFTPKPLVTDLLRTRYCVPGSIFLVEDIESLPLARSRRWRTVRLMLGDGELCIQALLRGEMHRFIEIGAIRVGCYVRLGDFAVRFRDVVDERGGSGRTKQMVYLVIDDLITVGWHRAFTTPDSIPQQPQELEPEEDLIPDSDLDDNDIQRLEKRAKMEKSDAKADLGLESGPPLEPAAKPTPLGKIPAGDDDDENGEDGFEVMQVSDDKTTQRRVQAKNITGPVALARDWTDPSIPLKLTSLRSIPNLPFKQNWSVNVLAVIASLSDVEPSHMPPHTQRTARLADPTTKKQVILTVFLDAETFDPKVGSVVLLVGVKNHRFDGGCLKKYVSDRPMPGNRWWFEEPRQFEWCDVDGLKSWWEQKQRQGSTPNNT